MIVMLCCMNHLMLFESFDVVDAPNDKFLKKNAKKFQKNLNKLFCQKDDLIAKLNESNKLVKKYEKPAEDSLEKLKEFECLNIDLDAKLVLSNKFVDELKCENESLKMHCVSPLWCLWSFKTSML